MTDDRRYVAEATPQHTARLEGVVLPSDDALGLGERCRLSRATMGDVAPVDGPNCFDPDLIYFAASVQGSGEHRACEWLRQADYTTFVPSRAVEIRHARKRHLVRRPVFPGYVFVGRTSNQSTLDILRVPGVRGLISSGEKPTVMPPWIMRSLAAADELGAFDGPPPVAYKPGQKVKLLGDLWKGLIGEVMRAPDSRRMWVLLDAFGKKQKLEVDVDLLAAA